MELSSKKEFSLKWNNFSSNLTTGFMSHLNESDLVDVTLAVDGRLLSAHKLVLSVCSSYFKNIFKKNPCQHPVIILEDVKHEQMEALLKFMYQGEVIVRQEDLPSFLKVAHTLRIRGLENSKGQVIPLLNDYIDTCKDVRSDSESTVTLSDFGELGKRKRNSDEFVCSQNLPKLDAKRNKTQEDESNCDSIEIVDSETSGNGSDTMYLQLNNNENDSRSERDVRPTVVDDDKVIDQLTNEHRESPSQSKVEPVTYRLSTRGRPQLVHEGYVYNLTSRSKTLNRSHYRCTEQHRGCRGKCAVIAERFVPTGVHDHNHPPGYQSEHDYRKKKGLNVNDV